jgi:hypothetical protein
LKDANEKVWNYDFTLILPSGRFSVCFPETHNNRKIGGEKNLLHPDQIRRMEIGYVVPRIILVIRSTEMEKNYRYFLIGYKLLKSKLLKIMPIILYKSYGSSSFKPMLAGWSLCLKHDVQLMSQVLMYRYQCTHINPVQPLVLAFAVQKYMCFAIKSQNGKIVLSSPPSISSPTAH